MIGLSDYINNIILEQQSFQVKFKTSKTWNHYKWLCKNMSYMKTDTFFKDDHKVTRNETIERAAKSWSKGEDDENFGPYFIKYCKDNYNVKLLNAVLLWGNSQCKYETHFAIEYVPWVSTKRRGTVAVDDSVNYYYHVDGGHIIFWDVKEDDKKAYITKMVDFIDKVLKKIIYMNYDNRRFTNIY